MQRDGHGIGRRVALLAAAAVALAITGCSVGPTDAARPSSGPASAGASSPIPAGRPSGSPSGRPSGSPGAGSASSGATGTRRTGKPDLEAVQTGLVGYFSRLGELDQAQARKAARCALYPTFQDLSAASLNRIVQDRMAPAQASDAEVFADIVNECVTASK